MFKNLHLIPVSANFWQIVAQQFLSTAKEAALPTDLFASVESIESRDFSDQRVVVPTFEHANLFLAALKQELGAHFIPPKIHTMFAWLGMQAPLEQSPSASSERLMRLYAQLRQHAWLRDLFGAERNTDLLPLAHTLLSLSDELTQAWLPKAYRSGDQIDVNNLASTWQDALAQLPLPVQKIVLEETQLIWTLWKAEVDQRDKHVQMFRQMMHIADNANSALTWIAPTLPNPMEQAFLRAYEKKQSLQVMTIDWQSSAIPESMREAWPDLKMVDDDVLTSWRSARKNLTPSAFDWQRLRLCEVASLEQEAEQAAQTIVDWLQAGKTKIAVIAQDRVVSRRLRALLERAHVFVADETGWKLSTTRAASALAAWFEVVATRADTLALLDFLKSPFLPFPAMRSVGDGEIQGGSDDRSDDKNDDESGSDAQAYKADIVMDIELSLRRNNVVGGWESIVNSIEFGKFSNDAERDIGDDKTMSRQEVAKQWITQIARLAHQYGASASASRRSLQDWLALTEKVLTELAMMPELAQDLAGKQVLQMLQSLNAECQHIDTYFSFSEWRAFMNLQLEEKPFTLPQTDKRVMMLPLNGARLRTFDAVYLIGGDAKHLPSKPQETLFFTNAVRRECGLVTREQRQQQQLRDFAELILSNAEIVVSWQSQLNGEYNALSPWLEQVNLQLARQAEPRLKNAAVPLSTLEFNSHQISQPRPSAAVLMPEALSASGFSSLMACPYQFFAGRMLKLSAIDELNDMPEKRDYGDWLHRILKDYHDSIRDKATPCDAQRVQVLQNISDQLFAKVLKQTPAALGYSMRWNKVIPAYVEWANQREQDGWQFAFGEVWAESLLSWDNGQILLRGRIDRIDERRLENGEHERAVLDYKTKTKASLRARLKKMNDHQLAFYGLLQAQIPAEEDTNSDEKFVSLEAVGAANYVALELEKEKIGDAEASQYGKWKIELERALLKAMRDIQKGSGMPAQGVESVCQYCDVRGLCRKGAW